jgi:hypothetical protein
MRMEEFRTMSEGKEHCLHCYSIVMGNGVDLFLLKIKMVSIGV